MSFVDYLAPHDSFEQSILSRLEQINENKHLNAFMEVFADSALQQARNLDVRRRAGETLGNLAGMTIGIKDVICMKGQHVSAGSPILAGFRSLFTATALQRLLDEDAIVLGRLNCDEFAMGSTSENPTYGAVRNAADPRKVAGGSSGGSAVAVQAGLCHAALGSDTGGSVRQPAAFCNVVGMKPTYGRISRHGLIAYASSFDQIGILATSVADAALLLEIMAGKDPFDATSLSLPVESYSSALQELPCSNLRLAYLAEAITHPGLDPEIKQQTEHFLENLALQGHSVQAVSFPYLSYIVPTYYVLTAAEAASNLSRYDGIHYGYRYPNAANMEEVYRQSRTIGFGKEVKRRIMLGTFVLSAGYYDAYYSKAQKVRRLIQDATKAIFRDHDFLLMPTTPTTAFDIGSKAEQDPVSMFLEDIFTVQANLSGVPAISLPLFQHSNGMPFGLQIMADKYKEKELLQFAQSIS